jgi:hypothetical protein
MKPPKKGCEDFCLFLPKSFKALFVATGLYWKSFQWHIIWPMNMKDMNDDINSDMKDMISNDSILCIINDEALRLIVSVWLARPIQYTCVRALHFQANKPLFIIHLVRVLKYHLTSIRRSPIWGRPYPGRSHWLELFKKKKRKILSICYDTRIRAPSAHSAAKLTILPNR